MLLLGVYLDTSVDKKETSMIEKVKLGYLIETSVAEQFQVKAESVGITGARFVQGCMKAYVEGKFKMLDGEPFFETPLTSRETCDVTRLVRKSSKAKEASIVEEPLITSPFEAKKRVLSPEGLDPAKRKLISYNYPLRPACYDDTPHLFLDTPDGKGGTFKDVLIQEWLQFRIDADCSQEDWFDSTSKSKGGLECFAECCSIKFSEDNDLNFRYHKDDNWMDVVALDGILTLKHMKELQAAIPELRE